jgi:hypothetical protein
MPDGSVFYGELEYVHNVSSEICYEYEELSDKQKSEYKLRRHGYGIQLFGRTYVDENTPNLLCKYSG